MFYDLAYNPVFLIFFSYAIGVWLTEIIKRIGLYKWFENHNYISDELTRQIGVLHFGWLIRHTFMGKFNKKLHVKGKANAETLQQLKRDMTYSEIGHLMAFGLLLIFNIAGLFWGLALWYLLLFFFINLVFNLYLVFLQQYNKRRISKILNLLATAKTR
jgi:hypothetical protein